MRIVFFFILLVLGVAVGCGGDDDETALEKYNKQLGIDTLLIDNYLAEHGITAMADTSGTGLRYVIHEEGNGRSPKYNTNVPGDCFMTDYRGIVLDSVESFDSGDRFKTSLSGSIISGWKIGFQYLQEGDSATLYLPSGLAYGTAGSGSTIPANAILYFHVRLRKVTTPEFNPANGTYECYYEDIIVD